MLGLALHEFRREHPRQHAALRVHRLRLAHAARAYKRVPAQFRAFSKVRPGTSLARSVLYCAGTKAVVTRWSTSTENSVKLVKLCLR